MHTKQVDKIHTPHLFFLPRMTPHPAWTADTDYVVGDFVSIIATGIEYRCIVAHTSGLEFIDNILSFEEYGHIPYTDTEDPPVDHPVYDYPHQEETYGNGKGLRRRAKPKVADVPIDQTANAYLEKITGKWHFFVDGYYDGDLVYTWEFQPEYEHSPGDWRFQELDGTIGIDNELGVMTCTGVQGGFSWDATIGFSELNKKWSWTITAPGFTVRSRWIIDFTALGQQMLADGDLDFSYDDYTGNISDDEGVAQREIIFEPAGIDATSGWTVDPYLSVNDTGSTIVVTTSEDVITFTVATENAVLKESGSIRAVIRDDVCEWYVYDHRMYRWNHASGTPAGMAGNDYSVINIGTDWDYYPLTASEETNKAARETQIEDIVMAAPNTGTVVDDMVVPESTGSSGIAFDGGRHLEMASDEINTTVDIDRIGHVIVTEDGPYYTGDPGSPTDKLLGYWKLDDTDSDAVLDDETGSNNGVLQGEDCDQATAADAVRGTCIYLEDGEENYLDFSDGIADLTDDDKFTIMLWFKPAFAYDDGDDQPLLSVGSGDTDRLHLHYDAGGDEFILHNDINNQGSDEATFSDTYTSDAQLQQWHHLTLSVDLSLDIVHIKLNAIDTHYAISDAWQATVDFFHIGTDDEGVSNYGAYYVDGVKLLNNARLYGAHFVGNDASQIALAHEDILFYADFEGANDTERMTDKINSTVGNLTEGQLVEAAAFFGTYGWDSNGNNHQISWVQASDGDILDKSEGSLSFWLNPQTIDSKDWVFGTSIDAQNFFTIYVNADGSGRVDYEADNVAERINWAAGTFIAGQWIHIRLTWSQAEGNLRVFTNGVEESESPMTIANAMVAGVLSPIYFGANYPGGGAGLDCFIDEIYITNNPNTPQIPVYLGVGPELQPTLSIE